MVLEDTITLEGGVVREVVVDGQAVVRDGALVNGDIEAIRSEAREAAQALWTRMRAL